MKSRMTIEEVQKNLDEIIDIIEADDSAIFEVIDDQGKTVAHLVSINAAEPDLDTDDQNKNTIKEAEDE